MIDSEVMHALLRHPDVDLSSESGAAESAARLAAHVATVKIEPEYDAAAEEFRLKITRMHHGNARASTSTRISWTVVITRKSGRPRKCSMA